MTVEVCKNKKNNFYLTSMSIYQTNNYYHEYNPKKVTSQSLGQAGFGSPVEECDKAQADLAHRVEEIENAKGVTQDE